MTARECYVATLKEKRPKKALLIDALEVWDEMEEKRAEPVQRLDEIQIEEGK